MRPLSRRLVAEYAGSLLLAAVVIGSGIAAQRLSPGDVGLQLLENAAATAAGLYTIILMFAPASGAHFNPVVSLVDAVFGGLPWRDVLAYIPVQVTGCVTGAMLANLMFWYGCCRYVRCGRRAPCPLHRATYKRDDNDRQQWNPDTVHR